MSQQEQLEAEFPSARLGSVTKGGTKLTYVPASEVIQRLNDVLGPTAWSWETVRVWRDEHDPDWVLAIGKMTCTIDGITSTKAGEGGVKVKKLKDGVTLLDLGDEFKGAASDALKKSAQKFGVALYLARTDQARKYEEPNPVRDPVDEGYDSAEHAKALIGEFNEAVKAQSDDVQQALRYYRDKIGVVWPPTRDELMKLAAEADRLSRAAQSHEKPPEPVVAPTPHEPDRYAAAAAFVTGLSKTDLVANLTDYKVEVPRTTDAQREALVTAIVGDESWQPNQEKLAL